MSLAKKHESILIVSDLHSPYIHPDTYKFLAALKAKFKPQVTVFTGDEVDYHNLSYHESHTELDSSGKELIKAIKFLEPIYKMFPEAWVLESNHGSMVLRKSLTAGIPQKAIKSYNEILDAPKGWKWVPDLILNTPTGPVYFCHGKTSTPGRLASQYGCSTVQGHFHEKFQLLMISTPERLLFDMIVGCMIDKKSLAFAYNKINVRRPVIGCGVIINGVAQLVPMILNSKGRWVGSL